MSIDSRTRRRPPWRRTRFPPVEADRLGVDEPRARERREARQVDVALRRV